VANEKKEEKKRRNFPRGPQQEMVLLVKRLNRNHVLRQYYDKSIGTSSGNLYRNKIYANIEGVLQNHDRCIKKGLLEICP